MWALCSEETLRSRSLFSASAVPGPLTHVRRLELRASRLASPIGEGALPHVRVGQGGKCVPGRNCAHARAASRASRANGWCSVVWWITTTALRTRAFSVACEKGKRPDRRKISCELSSDRRIRAPGWLDLNAGPRALQNKHVPHNWYQLQTCRNQSQSYPTPWGTSSQTL
jgi:hypothetical protein